MPKNQGFRKSYKILAEITGRYVTSKIFNKTLINIYIISNYIKEIPYKIFTKLL